MSSKISNEKLINLVYERKFLYKMRNADYKDRMKRESGWRDIGNELGLSDLVAKTKWTSLRDRYAKEKKRLVTSSEPNGKKRKVWRLMDRLKFLDNEAYESETTKGGNKGDNEMTSMTLEQLSAYAKEKHLNRDLDTTHNGKKLKWHNMNLELIPFKKRTLAPKLPTIPLPVLKYSGFRNVQNSCYTNTNSGITNANSEISNLNPAFTNVNSGCTNPVSVVEEDSHDKHFVMSLLGPLSRLPLRKKEEVKLEIQSILLKKEFD